MCGLMPTTPLKMAGLKLNLGCGVNKIDGYINVDKYGEPDFQHDLEILPWPWTDNSVQEIRLIHVLEHLGQQTDVYLGIIKEMYRICQDRAIIFIKIPHYRHEYFFDDPTHVRVVTPNGLRLFSQRINRETIERGGSNSLLGINLGVDFEIIQIKRKPGKDWLKLHPNGLDDSDQINLETSIYNNLIEEYEIQLEVIKT